MLVSKDLAVAQEEEGRVVYLISQAAHETLMSALAAQGFPLRASVHPV